MEIITIDQNNINQYLAGVAAVHNAAYSDDHFTSTFGFQKLLEYNRFLIEAADISLVCVNGKNVLGFLIAGYSVGSGVKAFSQENSFFIIKKLLQHPKFLFSKLLQVVLTKVQKSPPRSNANFRLLSIAVEPKIQSGGVGAMLLGELERRLAEKGIMSYGLSVKKDNPRAIKFYERNGFFSEKEFLGSVYFVKNFDTTKPEF